jgi:Pyruvate/2-oxoglutarate dehydrogenase complex, dihydrolipoamide acyltransferase (E2) component, and related enzymes
MAVFEIKMPKLGESITEGTIVSWAVGVGDRVNEDDVLFEVSTAKVSAEIPSPVAGVVSEILAAEGDTIEVGVVVAKINMEGEPAQKPQVASEKEAVEDNKPDERQCDTVGKLSKGDADRWYSPVVLSKAKEAGIGKDELDAIKGTGYLGRVSKKDIEAYIGKKNGLIPSAGTMKREAVRPSGNQVTPSVPVVAGPEDQVVPMDPVRRVIADRMVESRRISPHVTTFVEADVTRLVKWRDRNKDDFKKQEGVSLTFMPPIMLATCKALRDFPRINSSVAGYNIIKRKHINIGVAVSLPDGNLVVPVVKDADRQSISGLSTAVSSLAVKARSNKLKADEIQGGTFTITNYGSFKTIFATPIINQPEVAILGVGSIEKKADVLETPEGDVIAIRHKMNLALSFDHRVIDGSLGGTFLRRIADYLENWNEEEYTKR